MKPSLPYLLALTLGLAACQAAQTDPPASADATAPATPAATSPAIVPGTPPTATKTVADGKPSFDCATASSNAEKLVCGDAELATLDRRLADVYARAQAAPGADATRLAAGQRDWAKERDACWQSVERGRCVSEAYMTRLARLQIDNGEVTAPDAMAYECDDSSKPFTVAYYNTLDPQTAVVTWGDEQAIAFPMMAASGARYGREGMEIWEHQGEISVDFNGHRFNCRVGGASAP